MKAEENANRITARTGVLGVADETDAMKATMPAVMTVNWNLVCLNLLHEYPPIAAPTA
jgi:hypothetical protein